MIFAQHRKIICDVWDDLAIWISHLLVAQIVIDRDIKIDRWKVAQVAKAGDFNNQEELKHMISVRL